MNTVNEHFVAAPNTLTAGVSACCISRRAQFEGTGRLPFVSNRILSSCYAQALNHQQHELVHLTIENHSMNLLSETENHSEHMLKGRLSFDLVRL